MNRKRMSVSLIAVFLVTICVQSPLLSDTEAPATFRFESDVETWNPRADTISVSHEHGERDQAMLTVRLTRTAAHWRNVVALSWAPVGRPVQQVDIETQGDVTTFRSGESVVSLDWTNSAEILKE